MELLQTSKDLGFRKCSSIAAILSDTPEEWEHEIEGRAFEALPFLSRYDAVVRLDAVEPQQGYAVGSVEVSNFTDRRLPPGGVDPSRSVQMVRIPIVVREKRLAPLDLFLRGKRVYPLTENRLSAAIFRADVFDAIDEAPPDRSLVNMLYPPHRISFGLHGGMNVTDKFASVAILPEILPLSRPEDIDRVKEAVADPEILLGYLQSGRGSFPKMMRTFQLPDQQEKLAAAVKEEFAVPNVLQFRLLHSGKVGVKLAQSEAFEIQEDKLDPEIAELMVGSKITRQLKDGETVTVSTNPVVREDLNMEKLECIEDFGEWRVRTLDGRWLMGWVFPTVLDWGGTQLPISLFTNGSEWSLQESIAGSRVGQGTNLPTGLPQGVGCLIAISDGRALATAPFEVAEQVDSTDVGITYRCADSRGLLFNFTFAPDLKKIMGIGPDEYAVPDSMKFMPITGQMVPLESDPDVLSKVAKAILGQQRLEIRHSGSTYSVVGSAFTKLGHTQRESIGKDEAVFLCCLAGLTPNYAEECLTKAASVGRVEVFGCRKVLPLDERLAAFEAARTEIEDLVPNLRQDTVKIAAVIGDPMAVDNLLSLNFVTVDNVRRFIQYAPELEYMETRLAEMLLASRFGLTEVPEEALERALTALEEVIVGLKTLSQKKEFRQ